MNDQGQEFRFRHTMLPVSDLDRSVAFYTNLLGMHVMRELRVSERGGHKVSYVGYGKEGTHPALELIEDTSNSDNPWSGHFAIAVSDLPALITKLKVAGVRFTSAMIKPETGMNDYVANILDPDGFEIELTQRTGGIYN
jgi:lactoylglutathione lyase